MRYIEVISQGGHRACIRIRDIQIIEIRDVHIMLVVCGTEFMLGTIVSGDYEGFDLEQLIIHLGIELL